MGVYMTKYYDVNYHNAMKRYDSEKAKTIIENKREELIAYGWFDYLMEGGVVSPDLSTIFIYSRAPYHGQYLQFRQELKKEFLKIVHDNNVQFEIKEVKST
jgi:hypothetical protein